MPEILLATYNGARHLPQQLQSILEQTDPNWTLLIRDDNSTDGTQKIIKEFEDQHPDRVKVVHDHGPDMPNDKSGGAAENFARLLAFSQSNNLPNRDRYVMFCDQDDVWRPNKIEESLRKIHEMERDFGSECPLLVHTDFSVTHADMSEAMPSENHGKKAQKERTDINRLLDCNVITGMTMLMNRPLVEKALPIPTELILHDDWIGKVAALFGHIGYIDKPMVNYRQHDKNVVGTPVEAPGGFAKRLYGKMKQQGVQGYIDDKRDLMQHNVRRNVKIARALLEQYGNDENLKVADREVVEALATLPDKSLIEQRRIMLKYDLLPKTPQGKLGTLLLGVQRNDQAGSVGAAPTTSRA